MPPKVRVTVTQHALTQLGERCKLPWSRDDFQWWLARADKLCDLPNGSVHAIYITSKLHAFPVIRGTRVVTVLNLSMAFADCPQATFAWLIRQGALTAALELRHKLNRHQLVKGLNDTSVFYNRDDDVLWAAFRWCDKGSIS